MMDKRCGNCRQNHCCQKCNSGVACKDHKWDYGSLEIQLSRYQPHPFDPEKRETWPEFDKYVLVEDQDRKLHKARMNEIGTWIAYKGPVIFLPGSPVVGSIIWWSYLPGEEG